MPHWTFDNDNEDWAEDLGMAYTTLYHAMGGTVGDGVSSTVGSISASVSEGDPWSIRVRAIGVGTQTPLSGMVTVSAIIDSVEPTLYESDSLFIFENPTDDTGWISLSGTLPMGGTLTGAAVTFGAVSVGNYYAMFDDYYISDTPGGLRLLRMEADSGNLYVTGIEDNTLSLYTYGLTGLAVSNTETFGTCTYTAPDSFTNAVYPAATMVDGWMFVYGRDGNNKQVQFSTNGGTTFADVGAGTATWATSKFCASLMVNPGNPVDLIAAFYDNDVYRSVIGTATSWTKQGDNSGDTRIAARHPTFTMEILTAGTAAGTIEYSPNAGQSFTGVGGTVIAGTINAIAISRW